MRDQPSAELLDLLARLNLASAAQVRSVARRVRHLAGDLPHIDSVWIDALAQARRLTAYQAREINAGRGLSLAVGDYRILDRLPSPGYADVFRVRRATGEPHPEETPTATLVLAHDA